MIELINFLVIEQCVLLEHEKQHKVFTTGDFENEDIFDESEEECEGPEQNQIKTANDINQLLNANQSNFLVETETYYEIECDDMTEDFMKINTKATLVGVLRDIGLDQDSFNRILNGLGKGLKEMFEKSN